eukprot:gene10211-8128_t
MVAEEEEHQLAALSFDLLDTIFKSLDWLTQGVSTWHAAPSLSQQSKESRGCFAFSSAPYNSGGEKASREENKYRQFYNNCDSAVEVIRREHFNMPENDTDMLVQSHRNGLCAWEEPGADADSDGDMRLYAWEEPGADADSDGPLMLVAYVHYQELLPLTVNAGVPVPQALSLPPMTASDDTPGRSLTSCPPLVPTRSTKSTNSAMSTSSAGAGASTEASSKDSISEGAPAPVGDVASALAGISLSDVAEKRTMASITRDLRKLCEDEGMMDLALVDLHGRVLMGRAGVELWVRAMQSIVYCCHFLVDVEDEDAEDAEQQVLWDNTLWLCPNEPLQNGTVDLTMSCWASQILWGRSLGLNGG